MFSADGYSEALECPICSGSIYALEAEQKDFSNIYDPDTLKNYTGLFACETCKGVWFGLPPTTKELKEIRLNNKITRIQDRLYFAKTKGDLVNIIKSFNLKLPDTIKTKVQIKEWLSNITVDQLNGE